MDTIQDKLKCSICSENYTDETEPRQPRLLPCCGVSYCSKCIDDWVRMSSAKLNHASPGAAPAFSLSWRCPNCRRDNLHDSKCLPLNRGLVEIIELLNKRCASCKCALDDDCFLICPHCDTRVSLFSW